MYNPIDFNILKQKKTQVHYLSYYVKWDPQEMFYYAAENTGFEPNNERSQGSYSKYAGIDDILEWLHFYMIFIKFGIEELPMMLRKKSEIIKLQEKKE